MDVVNIMLSILGIGFLIFVHELGHFLAAKRVGIRVETFALGFQPTIFGWKARLLAIRRGDTEYVIGLLPFGGYVKMAGEEAEDPRTGASYEYASKTPSQRAFVLVAGASMNLLFGFLLFILAFSIGVEFPGTRLGTVLPGGPAWEAGLRPGDRILEVNGKLKEDFTDLRVTIAFNGGSNPLEVKYERPSVEGTRKTEPFYPRKDPEQGLYGIGIIPAMTRSIGEVVPDSAGSEAGLEKGDRIISVAISAGGSRYAFPDSWPIEVMTRTLGEILMVAPDPTVELMIEREAGSSPRLVSIPLRIAREPSGTPILGAVHSRPQIFAIQPGSDAASAFRPGQIISAVDGIPVESLDPWTIISIHPEPGSMRLGFAGGGERLVDRDRLIDWIQGSSVLLGPTPPRVTAVQSKSAGEGLGLRIGDQLLRIGSRIVGESESPSSKLAAGTEVVWSRDGVEQSGTASEEGEFGVELASIPRIGHVVPGGPAAGAGILPGDTILAAGGEPIVGWKGLLEFIEDAREDDSSRPISLTIQRGGEQLVFDVTLAPSARREIGIAFEMEQILRKTSPIRAIAVGADQTWIWGQRIFLMLGALARRDVSPKNLAGPVGIVDIGRRVAEHSISKLIFVLAMISVNLGIFNLLPFPILDGGHLAFLLVEKIKGSPVDERVQGWAHFVAFVLLIGMALFVTYHDILRIVN